MRSFDKKNLHVAALAAHTKFTPVSKSDSSRLVFSASYKRAHISDIHWLMQLVFLHIIGFDLRHYLVSLSDRLTPADVKPPNASDAALTDLHVRRNTSKKERIVSRCACTHDKHVQIIGLSDVEMPAFTSHVCAQRAV